MADRVVLITGASTGIGAATARRAVAAGDRVVLAARRKEALDALAAELGADNALAVACDVTEWDQVEALTTAAIERFGRIDVVFANAGFGATRGFLNETPEHWRAMVLTNVLGVAHTIRATLGHMPSAAPATTSSRARSPAAGRCPGRSTRPRSGRSPASARACAASCARRTATPASG